MIQTPVVEEPFKGRFTMRSAPAATTITAEPDLNDLRDAAARVEKVDVTERFDDDDRHKHGARMDGADGW